MQCQCCEKSQNSLVTSDIVEYHKDYVCVYQATMRRWPNVALRLAHRLRRRPNSKPTLGQRHMYGRIRRHMSF